MAVVADSSVCSSIPPAATEEGDGKKFQRDVNRLVDLLSKLNPSAQEFFPSSYSAGCPVQPVSFAHESSPSHDSFNNRRRKYNNIPWRRRLNGRGSKMQRDNCVRRTVYVTDIDQNITEEQLAVLFVYCGQVIDCRICGDPRSVFRFAFVEFADEEGAKLALDLSGTMLGCCPVKVSHSKTAILPVNPTYLPRSEDEREMCARTIYCTNIDNEASQADVKMFFESICGEISRLRLLGDQRHQTRIAFVEFVWAESAIMALNCSGMLLGNLPIRVSPSKTPVRPRTSGMILD